MRSQAEMGPAPEGEVLVVVRPLDIEGIGIRELGRVTVRRRKHAPDRGVTWAAHSTKQ